MKSIAKFEKVSYEQFKKDLTKQSWLKETIQNSNDSNHEITEEVIDKFIRECYDKIIIPKRATIGSAGYDFSAPVSFIIPKGLDSVTIPTGIRCKMNPGYVLSIYPRSGLGFKHRVSLDNTVGIIDQDYYNSDNEGHIMIKLHSEKDNINIDLSTSFAQGIFTRYYLAEEDEVTTIRNGGFGSTSNK